MDISKIIPLYTQDGPDLVRQYDTLVVTPKCGSSVKCNRSSHLGKH